jgi:hypothetical protein
MYNNLPVQFSRTKDVIPGFNYIEQRWNAYKADKL